MNESQKDYHLTMQADEEGCNKLTEQFEAITALYNADSRADKQYVVQYMHFKELVRYFLSKQGSRRSCQLTKKVNGTQVTFTFSVLTRDGEVINTAIFAAS